jgi:hypothetical protein
MHWMSPFFYMEAKFETLGKRIKNDLHQSKLNFSEQLFTPFWTTKKSEEILEELKVKAVNEKLRK